MVKFPLKALSGGFAASSPRGRAKLEAQQPDKHPFIYLNNGWLHLIMNTHRTKPRYTEVFAEFAKHTRAFLQKAADKLPFSALPPQCFFYLFILHFFFLFL